YVKGSREHCEYLTKRSAAGKRGALKTNEILNGKRRQKTPSSSSSSSISYSSTQSLNQSSGSVGSSLWLVYNQEYYSRYGVSPVRNVRVNSQLKQLGQRLGADASAVIKF